MSDNFDREYEELLAHAADDALDIDDPNWDPSEDVEEVDGPYPGPDERPR